MSEPSGVRHPIGTIRNRLRKLWCDRIDPDKYLGLHLTIGLVVSLAGIWIFSALLDSVLDNDLMVRWDIATDLAIHERMTPPSLSAVDAVTQLGSPTLMVILCVVVGAILWYRGSRTVFWGWMAAFVGGTAVGQILKMVVHRTRPVYGAAYLHGQSFSFPSGHAMGSMIGYGMCVYLLRHVWHVGKVSRRLATLLAVLLVVAIGLSRVLLGVHYPSDVVGGWVAGIVWMAFCITGMEVSRLRRMDRAHPVASGVIADAQQQTT